MADFDTMHAHFKKRTQHHIDLVQKYCKKLDDYCELEGRLVERGEKHDVSKFQAFEEVPYVYLTWRYKCKDDGIDFEVGDAMDVMIHAATEHHVLNNAHHPEYWGDRSKQIINEDDRDEPPEEAINVQAMPMLSVAHCVADWCAMSEERGNTPREWADKNVGVRWAFTNEQEDFIYRCIDAVWDTK